MVTTRNYERNRLGEADYTEIANAQNDYWIRYAEEEILNTYGDTVSVRSKKKNLLKFGQGSIDQVEKAITRLDDSETYVMDNLIDSVVSDDATNSQILHVEGHTIDGSNNLTFAVQSVTLNGQTPVTLGTPLARMSRMFVNDYLSSPLASGSSVYGYQGTSAVSGGTPSDATKIHSRIEAGTSTTPYLRNNQTQKATTSLSSVDYLIITSIYADMRRGAGTGAKADMSLKWRPIDSTGPKAFRTVFIRSLALAGNSSIFHASPPYIIIPKNSDIITTAIATANGTDISAGFSGALAIVTS